MKVVPDSRAGWLRAAALPFHVYVVIAWFWLDIYTRYAGRYRDHEVNDRGVVGYYLCFAGLAGLAVVQSQAGDGIGGRFSAFMALVALLLSFGCWPVLSKA